MTDYWLLFLKVSNLERNIAFLPLYVATSANKCLKYGRVKKI